MKKQLFALLVGSVCGTAAMAQFQVNPQAGLTYQNLTNPSPGVKYKGAAGWQLGADLRFGDRLYLQPGAFFGRNTTIVSATGDTIAFEDNLVRTNLKLKAMVGYRIIDTYQFDMRFAVGPTYDVLLSTDVKGDKISYDDGAFNKGIWNIDAALGFDMGLISLEPSVSFGLSRVFDNDVIVVKDIDSRYITYGLTLGVNIGNDDNE
ncbi:MAG: outer membrane beta-barrel protein [Flavobacteriales bacterium]|nr:outer membrane beta-barrel protein [Flavobacteriales bacterium]